MRPAEVEAGYAIRGTNKTTIPGGDLIIRTAQRASTQRPGVDLHVHKGCAPAGQGDLDQAG